MKISQNEHLKFNLFINFLCPFWHNRKYFYKNMVPFQHNELRYTFSERIRAELTSSSRTKIWTKESLAFSRIKKWIWKFHLFCKFELFSSSFERNFRSLERVDLVRSIDVTKAWYKIHFRIDSVECSAKMSPYFSFVCFWYGFNCASRGRNTLGYFY